MENYDYPFLELRMENLEWRIMISFFGGKQKFMEENHDYPYLTGEIRNP